MKKKKNLSVMIVQTIPFYMIFFFLQAEKKNFPPLPLHMCTLFLTNKKKWVLNVVFMKNNKG